MIDLSEYKCPHCGYMRGNYAVDNKAICGTCGIAVEGPDPDDQQYTAAAIFIRLSEAVHGKQHDGEVVEVRGMVVRSDSGKWVIVGTHHPEEDDPSDDEVYKSLASAFGPGEKLHKYTITATIPVPVAQEIKGRVENG